MKHLIKIDVENTLWVIAQQWGTTVTDIKDNATKFNSKKDAQNVLLKAKGEWPIYREKFKIIKA
jgi:hypothetical protein